MIITTPKHKIAFDIAKKYYENIIEEGFILYSIEDYNQTSIIATKQPLTSIKHLNTKPITFVDGRVFSAIGGAKHEINDSNHFRNKIMKINKDINRWTGTAHDLTALTILTTLEFGFFEEDERLKFINKCCFKTITELFQQLPENELHDSITALTLAGLPSSINLSQAVIQGQSPEKTHEIFLKNPKLIQLEYLTTSTTLKEKIGEDKTLEIYLKLLTDRNSKSKPNSKEQYNIFENIENITNNEEKQKPFIPFSTHLKHKILGPSKNTNCFNEEAETCFRITVSAQKIHSIYPMPKDAIDTDLIFAGLSIISKSIQKQSPEIKDYQTRNSNQQSQHLFMTQHELPIAAKQKIKNMFTNFIKAVQQKEINNENYEKTTVEKWFEMYTLEQKFDTTHPEKTKKHKI